MPLRRVTLSGRLAHYESEKPEPLYLVLVKGCLAMAFDTGVALGVAMLAYKVFMGRLAPPLERGFYCYEVQDISYPYRPNTVSSKHVIAVSLALPFFIIFCIEAIFFYYAKGTNRMRKWFYSTTSLYLEYVCFFTAVVLLIEGAKCAFGRLRPHYLSVCKPNWEVINCSDSNAYISSAHCTGADEHRIKIGRQSFPSGHSGVSMFFLIFMYLYLTGLMNASKLFVFRILRAVAITAICAWTIVVLITRVTDRWHHPTDVLGGIVIGIVSGSLPFMRKSPGSQYNRRLIEHPNFE